MPVPAGSGDTPLSGAEGGGASAAADGPRSVGGVVTQLAFRELPGTGLSGAPLAPFFVRLEDDTGALVPLSGERVELHMSSAPSGGGWVGFSVAETRDGIATFDGAGLDRAGTYRLAATWQSLQVEASAGVEVSDPTFVNLATNLPAQSLSSVLVASSNLIYVGTARGIYRSDNAGASWTRASFGINGTPGKLRARRAEPDVVYVMPGGPFSELAFLGRTLDRGATWKRLLPATFDAGPMDDVALDPLNPTLVWACGASGVYRSVDRGEHWTTTAFDGQCGALAFGGPAPGALYAYRSDGGSRTLLKSVDEGATWQAQLTLDNALTDLFISPSGVVFVATATELWRSSDGGTTWASSVIGLDRLASSPADPQRVYGASGRRLFVSTDGGSSFGTPLEITQSNIAGLDVDPSDAMRVYVLSGRLLVSDDGGASWGPPSTTLGGTTDVVFHPSSPGRVFAAGDGALYQSDDGGDSWLRREDGPASLRVLAFHPEDPALAYGCGSGFHASEDGGASWLQLSDSPAEGCFQIAAAGTTLWAATLREGVQRSLDGGMTWSRTSLERAATVLVADPGGSTLYAGTGAGTYKSSDGGDTWVAMVGSDEATAFAIEPQLSRRVWAAVCSTPGPLRLSVNAGLTWSEPAGFPAGREACASDLKIGSSGEFYALGQELYVSRDGGGAWLIRSATGLERAFSSDGKLAVSPDETTLLVALLTGLFRADLAGR